MGLTWPIDTKEVSEIPVLAEIANEFPGSEPAIKYLVYRFDPKSHNVHNKVGIDEKRIEAERLSGYRCPVPEVAFMDDLGEVHFSDEWNSFAVLCNAFFPILNNPAWELLVSIELALHEGNGILRGPIPEDADIDLKAKSQLLKISTAKGLMDMMKIRDELIARLADKDLFATSIVENGSMGRKNSARPKRDVTGAIRNE